MNKTLITSLLIVAVVAVGAGLLIAKSPEKTGITDTDRMAAGYAAGHVTIGPLCPVMREDMPCEAPPELYSSRKVLVYDDEGEDVLERGNIDNQGNYKIALTPGDYYLQIEPAGIGPGEKKAVKIRGFETTTVDFDIDTGIR